MAKHEAMEYWHCIVWAIKVTVVELKSQTSRVQEGSEILLMVLGNVVEVERVIGREIECRCRVGKEKLRVDVDTEGVL